METLAVSLRAPVYRLHLSPTPVDAFVVCPVVTMVDDDAEFDDENMCPPGWYR